MLYKDLEVPYAKELQGVLKMAGLPFIRTTSAWRESASGEDDIFDETVSANLTVLEKLGRKSGILANRFNILCFDRYPVELLERLYEERDRVDKPSGVAVVGRWDYDFVLCTAGILLSHMALKLDRHYLRVFEASHIGQFDSALKKVKELYGNEQLAEFGIIDAHASQNGMRLGAGIGERFSSRHLTGARLGLFEDVFAPEATVFQMGCTTGVNGGFAQKMSEKTGLRVFGADNLAWPMMIIPFRREGQQDLLLPVYAGVDGRVVNPVEYNRGVEVASSIRILAEARFT